MIIVKVVLPFPIRRYFKYFMPDCMYPVIGGRIIVPFHSKEIIGIVIDFYNEIDTSQLDLKYVISLIDTQSLYNKSILDILIWTSKNYQCPIGNLFFSILPKLLRSNYVPKKTYILKWSITKKGQELDLKYFKNKKTQLRALLILKKRSILSTELKIYQLSKLILKKLENQALCDMSTSNNKNFQDQFSLNNKSKIFVNKKILIVINDFLNQKYFKSWLLTKINLHVKVKFYLGLIKILLCRNIQILILVPYIKNINIILVFLKKYFNISINIFHSKLNSRQCLKVWLKTKNGNNLIIIGTKKSIFLPFFNLGLIIVLEEHHLQYKSISQCRYNFRDLGILRAYKENIPIILDSDTPSLRTLYNILYKKCFYINLPECDRINKYNYNIINLKREKTKFGLSLTLINEIYKNIKKKQVLLIFNKLSLFFWVLICEQCNWIFKCTLCQDDFEINEYHNILFCKFCLIKIEKPTFCYNCGYLKLVVKNINLEQIKNKIKNIFPKIPLFFLLKNKNINQNNCEISLKNPHIIISTEEIIENYYFPNVKLVSLISVDHHYFSFHFRSIEYFSQFYINLHKLTRFKQKELKIFIQTSFPNDVYLKEICNNTYHNFSKKLLFLRKKYLLPPWSCQSIIYSESLHSENNIIFLNFIRLILEKKSNQYNIFLWLIGPQNSLILKNKKKKINHLTIQCSSRVALNYLLNESIDIINIFSISKHVKWFVDIEPN
ncbi:primosomal protein N' [Buchnera aphidicola (Macrosiphoniella sanborni)]|uniref:Replication restart protein PriA n=1 Tax=Buchnera aphidicola (Macrosiphoniella sanborni) TaxID=1241865 RepID=A0A4D6YCB4_9GAMM|nr:primosomal protein N' [Buchnera aphidicola]QCI23678.1 primosomal protein N' [Buchnera aphidicola (Macrosiphoniella sanborni)]